MTLPYDIWDQCTGALEHIKFCTCKQKSDTQKRAQSAVDYLISRGIAPTRLTAVGYGETQFAVNCACSDCTEIEHQANRRTTFKIVE